TLRIILAHYYLRDRKATMTEVDGFLAASGNANVPAEVLEWLGIEYYNDKNYSMAEKYLGVLARTENPAGIKPDFWFYLGDVAGVSLLDDDPAITPRALDKAADAYRRAGKTDEADHVAKQLRDRYPNYAGG